MPLSGTLAPPRRPVLAQAAITLFRGLISGKKSDIHIMAFEHISDERGHRHVAGVEGQVNGLAAGRLRLK
jgi:hypothetical protein